MSQLNEQLIEQITKLVVEQLTGKNASSNSEQTNHIELLKSSSNQPFLERFSTQVNSQVSVDSGKAVELKETFDEKFDHARSKTPGRIGIGKTGTRPLTSSMLKFRYDHAAAVDSVYGDVDRALIDKLGMFTIYTKVEEDKDTYILRPDLGRKLSDDAKRLLQEKCKKNPQIQIIVSNGLSAEAINANLENVYQSLLQSIERMGLSVGTPFFIDNGRVGLMDDIGELLKPDVTIYLIGERPGLVTAESMSAYICYQPRHSTIESDRTVISNIHKGGIPPVEAGAYIGNVIEKILKYKASGVNLVALES